jgi:hypothetical protein
MPINQLQLPTYATPQSLDFSSLANLGNVYQKAQADQIKKQTLAELGQGGKVDGVALTAAGLKLGDMSLASLGQQLQNTEYSHTRDTKNDARQASQDALAQQHWQASYALQKAASERAGEDKFGIKEVTDPNTGATSFIKFNPRTGEVAPATGYTPPVSAPNNPFAAGKFNGDQGKAAGFTDRMLGSEGILSGIAPTPGEQGPILPGVQGQGADITQANLTKIPIIGNYAVSNDQQKYTQAKADFINAQLRRESGAAIGRDEFVNADKQYFPVPGDKPEVIRQKAANRRAAIEAMGREGGNSYKPKLNFDENGMLAPNGQSPQVVRASANAAPADQGQRSNPATFREPPKFGELRDGYRFKGGNPGDPSSWVEIK